VAGETSWPEVNDIFVNAPDGERINITYHWNIRADKPQPFKESTGWRAYALFTDINFAQERTDAYHPHRLSRPSQSHAQL
jgi:hypothetical protein